MDNSVYFVGDESLGQNLGRLLEPSSISLKSLSGLDPDLALTILAAASVPNLIVDCQSKNVLPTTVSLLSRIATGGLRSINLLTIGGKTLPLGLIASIDVLAEAHFEMNSQGGVVDLGQLVEKLSAPTARLVPEFRNMEVAAGELKTYTPELFRVVDDLLRVANRDVTILLVGETGSGKTTLARLVHAYSKRCGHPFQHLACGALPPDLIESELFGHVRGAFTGADRNKVGRFQAAGRGTLLLDEIDVLDVKQQAKLLKVIETGEYELVGSPDTQIAEARLIVASNVSLQELTEEGKFRLDLYYRLNVLEFRLPPLRERPLDLIPLAMKFVEELSAEHSIEVHRVHRDFIEALHAYHWPGNLRELKNHLRRAVLFSINGELSVNDLSQKVIHAQFAAASERKPPEKSWKLVERVAQSEKEMLRDALSANGNNRTRTAKALGISRVGLYKKLRRLGLIDDLPEEELAPA